jgi:hypothetical protein
MPQLWQCRCRQVLVTLATTVCACSHNVVHIPCSNFCHLQGTMPALLLLCLSASQSTDYLRLQVPVTVKPVVSGKLSGLCSQVNVGAPSTGPQVQLAVQTPLMGIVVQLVFHAPYCGAAGAAPQAVGAAADRNSAKLPKISLGDGPWPQYLPGYFFSQRCYLAPHHVATCTWADHTCDWGTF